MENAKTKSQKVREKLPHPIIDSDGHTVECEVAFLEYLKDVAGAKMVDHYRATDIFGSFVDMRGGWSRLNSEERMRRRVTRRPWWGLPARNTLDRAIASLPKLLHERLPETGVDFAVLYTTLGLAFPNIPDDELRQASCRALNNYNHDIFKEYSDRLTPTAVIPMSTPQEAIAELEHAVRSLGMKAIMMASHVRRQVPIVVEKFPEAARYATWIDNFVIDSPYDYDPVWAKCIELKVCPDLPFRVYDEPEFIVRNTWRLEAGWYDGVPSHLKPAPMTDQARQIAELAGGVGILVERANTKFAAGDLAMASHLIDWAVTAAPDDQAAHAARTKIYAARAAQSRSTMSHGIFRAAAVESAEKAASRRPTMRERCSGRVRIVIEHSTRPFAQYSYSPARPFRL